MTIRLVATDVDGTLLHSDGTASDRTRAALRAATDAGLLVAFVSGRPPRWLDSLVHETGHIGMSVGANGAVLYDMATEEIVSSHLITAELVDELTTELRAEFPDVHFAIEFGTSFAAEPGYVHDWEISPTHDRQGRPVPPPLFGELAEINSGPAVKLLAKDADADADVFLAAAIDLVGTRATITHSSSFGLLEISAPGVNKATGLAELAEQRGITADEVLAVGDMPNDVPMLRWAGRSYAVANAHPAAQAAAQRVVGRNDDDAVAELIEELLSSPR